MRRTSLSHGRGSPLHPEVTAKWLGVLDWSESILAAPKRSGNKHNLASFINRRVASFPSNIVMQPQPPVKPMQGASEAQIAQAVSAKLEDGSDPISCQ